MQTASCSIVENETDPQFGVDLSGDSELNIATENGGLSTRKRDSMAEDSADGRYQPGTAPTTADGITAAQHELILSILPFVKTVVGRVAMNLPSHVSQEDLLSAGVMGLMDAVRRFDPSKGASIKNYAAMRVRGAVLDELRKMDWVPRSVHRDARDFRKVQESLEQRLGRAATEPELARELKLTETELEQLLDRIKPSTFISLDDVRSIQDRGEGDLLQSECITDPDSVSPLDETSRREQLKLISDGIKLLPEGEQKVLALYYYEGLRLKEIAVILGVTESRISQVHALAIQRLRSRLHRVIAE